MTSYSFAVTNGGRPYGIHKQLDTTTADTVTVDSRLVASRVTILNRSATMMWARFDGSTAVAGADGTIALPPLLPYDLYVGAGQVAVSLVGDGEDYSVQASPHGSW